LHERHRPVAERRARTPRSRRDHAAITPRLRRDHAAITSAASTIRTKSAYQTAASLDGLRDLATRSGGAIWQIDHVKSVRFTLMPKRRPARSPKKPRSVATTSAPGPDFQFVRKMLTFGESYIPNPGDRIETFDKPTIAGTVVSVNDKVMVLNQARGKQAELATTDNIWVTSSPTITGTWDAYMQNQRPDGVAYADRAVAPALRTALLRDVRALAKQEPVDYHPGSGTRVRDLIHPSLYPYVRGKSKLTGAVSAKAPVQLPKYDRFGRVYEDSTYQWLPSQFQIDRNGTIEIGSYINNLAPDYQALYRDLATLFACALPLVESVLGYVQKMRFYVNDDEEIEHEAELPEGKPRPVATFPPRRLRGRNLQVIPKIVEYALAPGETHEGVWHVEGMSHEHIVATCVYVLERDAKLEGGELEFKRACTIEEAGAWFWGMDQVRPPPAQTLVEAAQIPLGRLATPQGRLFVFPNSHIHKLNKLFTQGRATAHRRVIVFWLVDPDVEIISTRDVAPQQATIKHADALKIRLKLMKERKRHKANFNVRKISLCEH